MDTNTLAPRVAASPYSPESKRMAGIKVWDAMMHGARKDGEEQGYVTVHNMPHIVGERSDFDGYLDFHKNHDVKLPSGAGVGMARGAQFSLRQTGIRECVPFLINRNKVI